MIIVGNIYAGLAAAGSLATANNGLTVNPAGNVQLGGTGANAITAATEIDIQSPANLDIKGIPFAGDTAFSEFFINGFGGVQITTTASGGESSNIHMLADSSTNKSVVSLNAAGGGQARSLLVDNYDNGIIIQDTISNNGLVGNADFTNLNLPFQYVQRNAFGLGIPQVVAYINVEGHTTGGTLLSYTPTFPGTFRITVTGGFNSGTGSVNNFFMNWTDVRSNAHAIQIPNAVFSTGSTSQLIEVMSVNAAAGIPLSVTANITGSVSYDYTIIFEHMPLPSVSTG